MIRAGGKVRRDVDEEAGKAQEARTAEERRKAEEDLRVGEGVELFGLEGAKELNGRTGTIVTLVRRISSGSE